ncbi:4-demethylwyosine synthase TYW1 [Candidatus Pacearchaeota archaeon]|nr:4-demethylwyosine synthase TYW1 [Candidatus Pacearchaeota archaeon]
MSSLNIIQPIIQLETEKPQMSKGQWSVLEKQGYRKIGNHSAVKVCEWTKKMLRGHGGCYKYVFYGIRSHQCLQMTTSMFCASRCKFCWRGLKAPVSKSWYGPVDSPEHIINHSIDAQIKLLQGFKGSKNLVNKDNKKKVSEMENIRHVALSLTGEPITYPLINEIIKAFHKRKISTFLVTNAQYPEQIKKIDKVTQLYLSIDAPNKKLMEKIDRPLYKDFWQRMEECLDLLKTRSYRTCIRLTLIKNENMTDLQGYADLINRGKPDFIELKSYVWVGESQRNYKPSNMPFMDDVRQFSKKLLEYLPDYEIMREHIPSRVVLLIKKSLKKKCWIDFPKFFQLLEQNKPFTAEDYCSKVMMPNK